MNEFKSLILGEYSVAHYAAAEVFALLALVVSLCLHSMKHDKQSERTPETFSWKFLILDNSKRIFFGQIIVFLLFRFTMEFTGKTLSMWQAVIIGAGLSFGFDKFLQLIKAKTTFLDVTPRAPSPPAP